MWQMLKKHFKSRDRNSSGCRVDDRRRLERIKMLLTINCHSVDHCETFRIMTENINTLGIKFISSIDLYVGEIIEMKILLHSNFPRICVNGRVVWCERKMLYGKSCYEGGIEFMALPDHEKKYLEKFIEKNRYDEFDPGL